MQEPVLMPFQNLPFNGDTLVCQEFLKLKAEYNLNTAIETGSCLYSTTEWLGDNFDKVYTVEISEDFAKFGRHKVADKPNVFAFIDDSVVFVKDIVTKLSAADRCIFFLDAHWGNNCPLLAELDAICNIETNFPPIIAIHDFKTDNPELGYDSYNEQPFTIDWILPSISKIEKAVGLSYGYYYNNEAWGAKRGVIYLYPIFPNHSL